MEKVVSDLKITIFEIIGYIIPGLLTIILVLITFSSKGLAYIGNYPFCAVVLAYFAGQLIHTIANAVDAPKKIVWTIYHRFKERNADGSLVENPKTCHGKIMNFLRENFLGGFPKENDIKNIGNKLVKEKYNIPNIAGLDLYYVKETLFSENTAVSSYFEHLSYQKTFSKNLAVVFLFSTLIFPIKAYYSDMKIIFSEDLIIDFQYLPIVMSVTAFVFYLLFSNRESFFRKYRNKILAAYAVVNRKL